MKLEDYNKYYIQGSDHYLIPKDEFKELFNEMINWKKESQKQKEVIDKAIEYVEGHKFTMKHYEPYGTPMGSPNYETHNIEGYYQLLDMLKEVSE